MSEITYIYLEVDGKPLCEHPKWRFMDYVSCSYMSFASARKGLDTLKRVYNITATPKEGVCPNT